MQLTPAQRGGINGGAASLAWMRRHGHTQWGDKLWSDAEVAILKELWPDRPRVMALLPGRTLASIREKAVRLNLPRMRHRHQWTAAEASRYRRMWPTATKVELLEAFPWASWGALMCYSQWQRKNGYPNLCRPRTPYKPIGDGLVDALIKEAFRLNLSLSDLDAYARSGRFFASGRYRRQRNWRHLGRALDALEAVLDVRFDCR